MPLARETPLALPHAMPCPCCTCCLTCQHCGVIHTGVSDHVRRGQVAHDKRVLATLHGLHHLGRREESVWLCEQASLLPYARSFMGWRWQPFLIPSSPYSTSTCGVCLTGGVAPLTASATPPTLISGCRSYVATLGDSTSCLSSRSNATS